MKAPLTEHPNSPLIEIVMSRQGVLSLIARKPDNFPISMNKHIYKLPTFSPTSPANILFLTAVFSGILITISANTWFSMWIGLELNLFGFVPVILASSLNQEKEAACKYFLAQAAPSAIFLICLILGPQISPSLVLLSLALVIKLGAAPCHQWLPSVINRIAWPQGWILVTVQKVAPILILIQVVNRVPTLLIIVAGLSSIVGGVGGINQTLLRSIIAYSSIGHIGWIIGAMLVSINIATLYLASYILIVSTTILSLALLKITSVCLSSSITKHPTLLLITAISFINIGGLPPLFGFFIKASVIKALIDSNLIRLLVPLIAGSVLNLYYYLKVVFINTLETPPQSLILKTINHPTQILLPILFSSSTVGAVVTLTLFLI